MGKLIYAYFKLSDHCNKQLLVQASQAIEHRLDGPFKPRKSGVVATPVIEVVSDLLYVGCEI